MANAVGTMSRPTQTLYCSARTTRSQRAREERLEESREFLSRFLAESADEEGKEDDGRGERMENATSRKRDLNVCESNHNVTNTA